MACTDLPSFSQCLYSTPCSGLAIPYLPSQSLIDGCLQQYLCCGLRFGFLMEMQLMSSSMHLGVLLHVLTGEGGLLRQDSVQFKCW